MVDGIAELEPAAKAAPEPLRRLALEESSLLSQELSVMLPRASLQELRSLCCPDLEDPTPEDVGSALVARVVDVLWAPLGGCVPTLVDLKDEDELRTKLQLFWRCSVALLMMPQAHLLELSRRKRVFLKDPDFKFPEDGDRLGHLRLNLPIFAMAAKLPTEEPTSPVAEGKPATEEEPPASPPKPEPPAAAAEPSATQKALSAARHTYDIGYKKWESFDVDRALQEVEVPKRRLEKVAVPLQPPEATCRPEGSASEVLEQALSKLKGQSEEPQAAEPSPVTDPEETTVAVQDAEAAATESTEQRPALVASSSSSTAGRLAEEYRRWEAFEGEEEEEEEFPTKESKKFRDLATDLGLDAITGPEEEVERIKAHWKEQERGQGQKARPPRPVREVPSLPEGPVQHRPCEYRPSDDPEAAAAKAIARDYSKWKSFDADAALLELDNEGTTQEGTAVRCASSKGSAMVTTENYTKDREEYDLDQDIAQHVSSLKKVLAQRLKEAAEFKDEGNDLLKSGKASAAAEAYKNGLEALEMFQDASVIMSDSLSTKQARLVADLYRNMAAALLKVGDYEGAKVCCDEVLKEAGASGDSKALYRRALAQSKLGCLKEAQEDLQKLQALLGASDPAVAQLQQELLRTKTS